MHLNKNYISEKSDILTCTKGEDNIAGIEMVTKREVYDYVLNSEIGVTVSQIAKCFDVTKDEPEKLLESLVYKRLLQTFNYCGGFTTYWLEKYPNQDALQNLSPNSDVRDQKQ